MHRHAGLTTWFCDSDKSCCNRGLAGGAGRRQAGAKGDLPGARVQLRQLRVTASHGPGIVHCPGSRRDAWAVKALQSLGPTRWLLGAQDQAPGKWLPCGEQPVLLELVPQRGPADTFLRAGTLKGPATPPPATPSSAPGEDPWFHSDPWSKARGSTAVESVVTGHGPFLWPFVVWASAARQAGEELGGTRQLTAMHRSQAALAPAQLLRHS